MLLPVEAFRHVPALAGKIVEPETSYFSDEVRLRAPLSAFRLVRRSQCSRAAVRSRQASGNAASAVKPIR